MRPDPLETLVPKLDPMEFPWAVEETLAAALVGGGANKKAHYENVHLTVRLCKYNNQKSVGH